MRLGRLWFAVVACLMVFCGVASANGLDPEIQLAGDPPTTLILINTFPNFMFPIAFPNGCTPNCTATDDFANDTGHILTSLTIDYPAGGLTCGILTGSPFTGCSVSPSTQSVTFSGGDIPIGVCVDTDHDGDGGANCNQDDTWTVGTFSMTFIGFNSGTTTFNSSATTVPEPASFGLIFTGLGALLAGYKRIASRRAL